MKKFGLVCAILASLLMSSEILAQRSYSSGGSRSSGSSSGGSRSSFGSSSGSRSGSSFGSSSGRSSGSSFGSSSGGGKSYSSGGGSKSSGSLFGGSSSGGSKNYSSGTPSGGTKSPSASSGSKNYSSGGSLFGGSKADSPSKYSSGKSTPPAATNPSASSGGKSYSSGKSPPADTPNASTSSGSKYSSGVPPPSSNSGTANSRKPTSSSFNSGLSESAKKQESKIAYEKATAPKASFTDSQGKTVNVNPADKRVETIRTIPVEKYTTRNVRVQNFYGPTYGSPIPQQYSMFQHDPFYNVWFWMWLMDRNRCPEGVYYDHLYNHRKNISDEQWKELVKKDAQLEVKLAALEKERNGVRNEAYVPPQFADNPDLMYTDKLVEASVNPVAVTVPEPEPEEEATGEVSNAGWWVLGIMLGLGVLGVIFYLVFVKEW